MKSIIGICGTTAAALLFSASCAAAAAPQKAAVLPPAASPKTVAPPIVQKVPLAPMKAVVPISDALFPPEMVLRAADQIGLDAATAENIRSTIVQSRENMVKAQAQLSQDTTAFNQLLQAVPPDQQKCLAQLDKVLNDEREIKRLTLTVMLEIKAKLTAEQIAKLNTLRNNAGPALTKAAAPATLRVKIQQVQMQGERFVQAGGDISAVKKLLVEAQALAQTGNFDEAEAKADEALALLKSPAVRP